MEQVKVGRVSKAPPTFKHSDHSAFLSLSTLPLKQNNRLFLLTNWGQPLGHIVQSLWCKDGLGSHESAKFWKASYLVVRVWALYGFYRLILKQDSSVLVFFWRLYYFLGNFTTLYDNLHGFN